MKKTIKLISLFLSFIILQSYGQEKKSDASQNIKMLKQGALFVRLKTSDLQINALKQKGREKEAEQIHRKQEMENKEIAEAFKNSFDFSKIYFFYSTNSAEIKKGNYKYFLLNTDLQKDTSFNGNDYLIGEFDESATTHIDAFIIKDKNFIQLDSPFPFLIKCNGMLVTTRTKEEVVKQLNKQLFEFWSKNK